jgi:hypothetical protein
LNEGERKKNAPKKNNIINDNNIVIFSSRKIIEIIESTAIKNNAIKVFKLNLK